MDTFAALAVILALIGGSTVVGLLFRRRSGRILETTSGAPTTASLELDGFGQFGSRATLLQFSTEVCAPCRATRRLLTAIADRTPGVEHVEVDLARAPELTARFRVTQAPTTFLLDGNRTLRARIAGAPQVRALTARLDEVLKETAPHA
jgi:thiol-disulfide isomerase/thioredoxin